MANSYYVKNELLCHDTLNIFAALLPNNKQAHVINRPTIIMLKNSHTLTYAEALDQLEDPFVASVAHLVIGREPNEILQSCAFDQGFVDWGVRKYNRNISGSNTLIIELVNYGQKLIPDLTNYKTRDNTQLASSVVCQVGYMYYQKYSAAQINTLNKIIKALRDYYHIEGVLDCSVFPWLAKYSMGKNIPQFDK